MEELIERAQMEQARLQEGNDVLQKKVSGQALDVVFWGEWQGNALCVLMMRVYACECVCGGGGAQRCQTHPLSCQCLRTQGTGVTGSGTTMFP